MLRLLCSLPLIALAVSFCSLGAIAQSLPAGWSDGDIGSVGVAGSASYANGVFTTKGSGTAIGGTSDQMHFAYQALSGNGTIVARVVSLTGATSVQAGVMIRETLNAGATMAYVYSTPAVAYF